MKILAIETSCDETAVAILEVRNGKFEVKSNVVLSQIKIHRPYGGVVPNLAKREHKKNLPIILKRALREAKIPFGATGSPASKLDIIAVTYGPGLEPALWEGINFAKELSKKWRVPLVAVNHLEGHIYASFLSQTSKFPKFPLLALIVSGGHTELVLMKKHLDYKILGETLDDAAGEAFDKVARMLGLGYPGGPEIAAYAAKMQNSKTKKQNDNAKLKIKLPRPMINSKDLNFSFSGLKTAVLYLLRDPLLGNRVSKLNKTAIAHEFQQAVVDVLVKKTERALRHYGVGHTAIKSFVVGGGVAANNALRHALHALMQTLFPKISLHISPLWLTGDNAAMIATAAYFKAQEKQFSNPETLKAQGNLKLGQ